MIDILTQLLTKFLSNYSIFSRSTKDEVRLGDIDNASVGLKDYQKSLFSVWHDMFSIPRPKRYFIILFTCTQCTLLTNSVT